MTLRSSTIFAASMIACGSSAPLTSSTTQPSAPVAATASAAPASAAAIEKAPPPATVDPSGAAADEKLAGTVLVWADASFVTGPSEKFPSMQLATLSGSRRDHLGEAVPMRVVSAKGDLLEVETLKLDELGNDETDCAWFDIKSRSDLGPLRLFVHRADLAPVLTAPFSKEFDDGTSLKLQPGTPVVPLADGRYQVLFASLAIPAALPASSVGHAYEQAFNPRTDAPYAWSLPPKSPVTLGDEKLTLPFRPFVSESVKQQGAVTLFPIHDRCGQAVVAAPSELVTAYTPADGFGSLTGIGMGGGGGERWYLPVNTPLATAEGTVITRSREQINVEKPAAGAKQVCIEGSLYISTNLLGAPKPQAPATPATLRLCAPARVVKHDKGLDWSKVKIGPTSTVGGGKSGALRAH